MNMNSVVLPNSVTSIGDEAFKHCYSLKSIIIPESVETIGYRAFLVCRFSSITIPRAFISFGGNPFSECPFLKVIDVSENPNFAFVDEVLIDKRTSQIVFCVLSKSGNYDIPSTVVSIGKGAFNGCTKLTSINIPDSVTFIDEEAFCRCIW